MEECLVTVKVIPKSKKNSIERLGDGTYRIHVNAPPVDGKANKALIECLSEALNISKSSIEIIYGTTGRVKHVKIMGLDAETVVKKIGLSHKG